MADATLSPREFYDAYDKTVLKFAILKDLSKSDLEEVLKKYKRDFVRFSQREQFYNEGGG